MPGLPEPSPAVKDAIAKVVTTVHRSALRLSGGRIGGRVAGMPVLELTTTGRTSGQARTTPLTYFEDGDRVLIVASYGGDDRDPSWYRNLKANPTVSITRSGRTEQMRARTLSRDEKVQVWPRITGTYQGYAGYQTKTDRDIPVVELSPVSS